MNEVPEKLKILEVLGDAISNGGQESFVLNVLNHIDTDKENFSIDILTPYYCDNEHYKNIIEKKGFGLYCFNLTFVPGRNRFNLIKPIKQFFDTHSYDVVHIHAGSTSVLAECALAARRAGVKKIIVHSHCATDKKSIRYLMLKLAYGRALRTAPTHYAACSEIAGESKFSKKICRNRLTILKNGVDLNRFHFDPEVRSKMRLRYDISDNCVLLGHVGRFTFQKNQKYILSVLKTLLSDGYNVKLMLIGSGEDYDKTVEIVKSEKLENHVYFIGNVNDVENYMQAMDVFVMPSRFEGLPIVGVEAQAAGLPCVFSDNITKEAAITPNVCFLPIDEASLSQWANAAVRLSKLERENNSRILRAKGYDIRQTADEIIGLYRS